MNVWLFLMARAHRLRVALLQRRLLKEARGGELTRAEWKQSLTDPLGFYLRCFRYFHQQLPADLRRHRRYFSRSRRGFGEDAFHTMWFLLHREFQPTHFLEIGVYRGQVLSLLSLLQQRSGRGGTVTGISPFSPVGDSVSRYCKAVNYYEDTLANFAHFSLPKPTLCQACSTDAAARALIASRVWDCIYIDGNHDYEVVNADWEICSRQVRPGGLIVLDDAGLTTPYEPPLFATRGHPGPSRFAQEIERGLFEEILQVGHNRVFQRIQR
jgi:hypothetical protein